MVISLSGLTRLDVGNLHPAGEDRNPSCHSLIYIHNNIPIGVNLQGQLAGVVSADCK